MITNSTAWLLPPVHPHMHEKTFRNASEAAGLNGFKCEMANIREQCSWVHPDKAEGTEKVYRSHKEDDREGEEQ